MKLFFSGRIFRHGLSFADQAVFVGDETIKTDRPSGVQFTGGDPDFRPEAVAVAVGKAGGAIAVNAGAVHHLQEVFRRLVIFGQNGIRVMGAVRIDMKNRLFYTGNQLDREDPVVILRPP